MTKSYYITIVIFSLKQFIDEHGNLICQTCNQKFSRERHFNSHRCKKPDDLYLAPEDIPALEEGFDSRLKFPTGIADDGVGVVDDTPSSEVFHRNDAEEDDDDETEVRVVNGY